MNEIHTRIYLSSGSVVDCLGPPDYYQSQMRAGGGLSVELLEGGRAILAVAHIVALERAVHPARGAR